MVERSLSHFACDAAARLRPSRSAAIFVSSSVTGLGVFHDHLEPSNHLGFFGGQRLDRAQIAVIVEQRTDIACDLAANRFQGPRGRQPCLLELFGLLCGDGLGYDRFRKVFGCALTRGVWLVPRANRGLGGVQINEVFRDKPALFGREC